MCDRDSFVAFLAILIIGPLLVIGIHATRVYVASSDTASKSFTNCLEHDISGATYNRTCITPAPSKDGGVRVCHIVSDVPYDPILDYSNEPVKRSLECIFENDSYNLIPQAVPVQTPTLAQSAR